MSLGRQNFDLNQKAREAEGHLQDLEELVEQPGKQSLAIQKAEQLRQYALLFAAHAITHGTAQYNSQKFISRLFSILSDEELSQESDLLAEVAKTTSVFLEYGMVRTRKEKGRLPTDLIEGYRADLRQLLKTTARSEVELIHEMVYMLEVLNSSQSIWSKIKGMDKGHKDSLKEFGKSVGATLMSGGFAVPSLIYRIAKLAPVAKEAASRVTATWFERVFQIRWIGFMVNHTEHVKQHLDRIGKKPKTRFEAMAAVQFLARCAKQDHLRHLALFGEGERPGLLDMTRFDQRFRSCWSVRKLAWERIFDTWKKYPISEADRIKLVEAYAVRRIEEPKRSVREYIEKGIDLFERYHEKIEERCEEAREGIEKAKDVSLTQVQIDIREVKEKLRELASSEEETELDDVLSELQDAEENIELQTLEAMAHHIRGKRLEDKSIDQALELYVEADAVEIGEDQDNPDLVRKDMMQEAQQFIESEQTVLLMLGDAGSGKTTFGKKLERTLWQEFKAGGRIPLFISLPEMRDPLQNVIEQKLAEMGFSRKQIEILKKEGRFVFILDGYDEVATSNIYDTNLLMDWNAKVVIACRREHLINLHGDYIKHFAPIAYNGDVQSSLLRQRAIAPFSSERTKRFIQQYVSRNKPRWSAQDYYSGIERNVSLRRFAKNPYMLSILMKALPQLNLSGGQKVLRYELYEAFFNVWWEENSERIGRDIKSPSKREALELFKRFGQRLATEMLFRGVTVIKINEEPWTHFFNNARDAQIGRRGTPLTPLGLNAFGFPHKSLLEFLVAQAVYETPEILGRMLPLRDDMPSSRFLYNEPSVVGFLSEKVKDRQFKDELYRLIEESKQRSEYAVAASNAITILSGGGEKFVKRDFKGVLIPYARFNSAIIDRCDFRDADLHGIHLGDVWMNGNRFSSTFHPKDGIQKAFQTLRIPSELQQLPSAFGEKHALFIHPDGIEVFHLGDISEEGKSDLSDRSIFIDTPDEIEIESVKAFEISPTEEVAVFAHKQKLYLVDLDQEYIECIREFDSMLLGSGGKEDARYFHPNRIAFSPTGSSFAVYEQLQGDRLATNDHRFKLNTETARSALVPLLGGMALAPFTYGMSLIPSVSILAHGTPEAHYFFGKDRPGATVYLFDHKGICRAKYRNESPLWSHVSISQDEEQLLISSGTGGTLRLDISRVMNQEEEVVKVSENQNCSYSSLLSFPIGEGGKVLSLTHSKSILLTNSRSEVLQKLDLGADPLHFTFNPIRMRLALLCADGYVYVYDYSRKVLIPSNIKVDPQSVKAISLSKDGETVLIRQKTSLQFYSLGKAVLGDEVRSISSLVHNAYLMEGGNIFSFTGSNVIEFSNDGSKPFIHAATFSFTQMRRLRGDHSRFLLKDSYNNILYIPTVKGKFEKGTCLGKLPNVDAGGDFSSMRRTLGVGYRDCYAHGTEIEKASVFSLSLENEFSAQQTIEADHSITAIRSLALYKHLEAVRKGRELSYGHDFLQGNDSMSSSFVIAAEVDEVVERLMLFVRGGFVQLFDLKSKEIVHLMIPMSLQEDVEDESSDLSGRPMGGGMTEKALTLSQMGFSTGRVYAYVHFASTDDIVITQCAPQSGLFWRDNARLPTFSKDGRFYADAPSTHLSQRVSVREFECVKIDGDKLRPIRERMFYKRFDSPIQEIAFVPNQEDMMISTLSGLFLWRDFQSRERSIVLKLGGFPAYDFVPMRPFPQLMYGGEGIQFTDDGKFALTLNRKEQAALLWKVIQEESEIVDIVPEKAFNARRVELGDDVVSDDESYEEAPLFSPSYHADFLKQGDVHVDYFGIEGEASELPTLDLVKKPKQKCCVIA